VEFIRDHADRREPGGLRWGVEPICAVLSEHGRKIAPSTYYEHVDKSPTRRAQREQVLLGHIRRVHAENYSVYGARKVWLQLNREPVVVARCTVERLMAADGLQGAVRGKVKRTTTADPAAERARDLVGRVFTPAAPDTLWVGCLRLDVVGVGVRRVRRRRLRPPDPGLARGDQHVHPAGPGRLRAGGVDPTTHGF